MIAQFGVIGSIPAGAGEPRLDGATSDAIGVYPRGRGGAVTPSV